MHLVIDEFLISMVQILNLLHMNLEYVLVCVLLLHARVLNQVSDRLLKSLLIVIPNGGK